MFQGPVDCQQAKDNESPDEEERKADEVDHPKGMLELLTMNI